MKTPAHHIVDRQRSSDLCILSLDHNSRFKHSHSPPSHDSDCRPGPAHLDTWRAAAALRVGADVRNGSQPAGLCQHRTGRSAGYHGSHSYKGEPERAPRPDWQQRGSGLIGLILRASLSYGGYPGREPPVGLFLGEIVTDLRLTHPWRLKPDYCYSQLTIPCLCNDYI